ncbi:MAG TPA: HyuE hydantoin racemase [Rhodobacterales bacterium]|nr:HyuE hydantoin racemase [Rhodobacterales bacterium]
MTDGIVAAARNPARTMGPGLEIIGMTNRDGPPAIEGAADGAAALPGLLACVEQAERDGAAAIIIACFDDTGLGEARAQASCPVLGIGEAAYLMARLQGRKFSVVTSLPVSVPVIEANIGAGGFAAECRSVRASGLPVLTIEEGGEAARARLTQEIIAARDADGAEAIVLGCAGMAQLRADLALRSSARLIDGVAASVFLAIAATGYGANTGAGLAPTDGA